MKIGLLRHHQVDQNFLKGLRSQEEVLQWFKTYDTADVKRQSLQIDSSWDVCYSSNLSRAIQTARDVFDRQVYCTQLLNEARPQPVFRSNLRMPFLLWGLVLKTAIMTNHGSQPHGRKALEKRLERFVQGIIKHKGRNVLIVSHSFPMMILSGLLLREGFSGKEIKRPRNGEIYIFELKH